MGGRRTHATLDFNNTLSRATMVCLVCYLPVALLVVLQWLMSLWQKYRAAKAQPKKSVSGEGADEASKAVPPPAGAPAESKKAQ